VHVATKAAAPKRIVLVYPDFTDPGSAQKSQGNYSEGLASISAVLKSGGHHVTLYHLCCMPGEEEYTEAIKRFKPDIVGFSVRTTAFPQVREFASWTKKATGAFTVCGGYHATLAPDEVIAAEGVDAVCIGEGEYPLLELANMLGTGQDFHHIQSIWFKKDGRIIKNPIRPLIEKLDTLPPADFELFDYPNLISSKMLTALVMVSRGCVFSCTYCSNSKLREVYPNHVKYARFKSAPNAISYLQSIQKKYPYIKYFNFRDAILNMDRRWFMEFIELYREQVGLPFTCNLRLDLLDSEVVASLKAAGCYMVDVGIESGDEEMRSKYLCRKMSDKQIKDAFRWFREHKISTLTYNMVGLPHEDLARALKTIKLNASLRPNRMIASIFSPYPMTVLTDISRNAGFIGEKVDFSRKVVLQQPRFKEQEVLFAHYYFGLFVTLYKLINKWPRPLLRAAETILDWLFTTKLLPRKLLVIAYTSWIALFTHLKHFLIRATPGLYLKLRNYSVKLNRASAKA
jgi:anaerobic magnesium-protoporphyrin IX monomethyl ester cyclase